MSIVSVLLYITLVTYGLSSAFLYTELLSGFRIWWYTFFSKFNIWPLNKIKYLVVCQLCCSFWFSIPVIIFSISGIGFIEMVLFAFATCSVSWSLGSWTRNNVESSYYLEIQNKKSEKDCDNC